MATNLLYVLRSNDSKIGSLPSVKKMWIRKHDRLFGPGGKVCGSAALSGRAVGVVAHESSPASTPYYLTSTPWPSQSMPSLSRWQTAPRRPGESANAEWHLPRRKNERSTSVSERRVGLVTPTVPPYLEGPDNSCPAAASSWPVIASTRES